MIVVSNLKPDKNGPERNYSRSARFQYWFALLSNLSEGDIIFAVKFFWDCMKTVLG